MSRSNSLYHTAGCQFLMDNNQLCGQKQTLKITQKFKEIYENRLHQIESGGDYQNSIQERINLLQCWIKDLTEQNDMLIHVVENLEQAAINRAAFMMGNLANSEKQRTEASNLQEEATELKEALEKERQSKEVYKTKYDEEIRKLYRTISYLEIDLQNTQVREDIQKTKTKEALAVDEDLKIKIKQLEEENKILKTYAKVKALCKPTCEMAQQSTVPTQEQGQSTDVFEALKRENVSNLREEAGELKKALEMERKSREMDQLKYDEVMSNLNHKISQLERELQNAQARGDTTQKADCVCGLQNKLLELREECKQQIQTNKQLKQQLEEVSSAIKSRENIDIEAKELPKRLQKLNGDLHLQADLTKQELLREAHLNHINTMKISELHDMVETKTMQLNECEGECYKVKQKLNITMQQNQELQIELYELKSRILQYKQSAVTSEELAQYCQKEIEKCKSNITNLPYTYIQTMEEDLHQKIEMCNKLEGELCSRNHNCLCLQEQLKNNQIRYEITFNDLTNKLAESENNYKILHENFKQSQDEIIQSTQRNTKLQMENKELTTSIYKLQQQELGLGESICQLETKGAVLQNEIEEKDRLMNIILEKNTKLSSKLEKMLKRFTTLKSEHEKLHMKYEDISKGLSSSEYKINLTKERYNQCICGLQALHKKKKHLEANNRKLEKELEKLQDAYRAMEIKYNKVNESYITLELKLLNNNMCREEICAESRTIISNVRDWLENQAAITEELTQKLRADELLIENLKQQIRTRNPYSMPNTNINYRGRGDSDKKCIQSASANNSLPIIWSPATQGSSENSLLNSCKYAEERYEYVFGDEDYAADHNPVKLETINEELKEWNQFSDTEMSHHDCVVSKDY